MSKCECHRWSYEHAIFDGERGGAQVRRYCERCGYREVGHITRWREERENEFDHAPDEERPRGW
jgi:hypothetical protein